VNLVVNDSVVHVWGIVRSEEHRKALYMALRSIPGVKSVEDHLSPNWFTNTTACPQLRGREVEVRAGEGLLPPLARDEGHWHLGQMQDPRRN
jgi:hypothetical protein